MPNIIIVNKTGELSQTKIKSSLKEDLYKKAGFKTDDESNPFSSRHNWIVSANNKSYNIHVYGKIGGRANQENKFEFPPPIDKILFFGNVVIANMISPTELGDITIEEWNVIYNKLYGGFEDIGNNDSTESEDEVIEGAVYTNDGYVKDGFVVSDDDNDVARGVPRGGGGAEKKKKSKKRNCQSSPVNSTPTKITRKKGVNSNVAGDNSATSVPVFKEKNKETVDEKNVELTKDHHDGRDGHGDNVGGNNGGNEIEYTSELEEEPYV
jgi:hypothetical protein